jgi:hypothetical protein
VLYFSLVANKAISNYYLRSHSTMLCIFLDNKKAPEGALNNRSKTQLN